MYRRGSHSLSRFCFSALLDEISEKEIVNYESIRRRRRSRKRRRKIFLLVFASYMTHYMHINIHFITKRDFHNDLCLNVQFTTQVAVSRPVYDLTYHSELSR